MNVSRWFLPSFHGDIRLERVADNKCRVLVERVTEQEKGVLAQLAKRCVEKSWRSSPWFNKERIAFDDRSSTDLDVNVEVVAKWLAKALKPGKSLVTAYRIAGGKIEEMREQSYVAQPDAPKSPYRDPAPPPPEAPEEVKVEAVAAPPAEQTVAVTVAKPVRGCPAPDFAPAEIRAREVLVAFLDDDQRRDFNKYNQFVAVGGASGHRYMITSRHAREQLARYGGRSVYDLDDNVAICTHDWIVPAAEECLTLSLLVQLPNHENWLRQLSDK